VSNKADKMTVERESALLVEFVNTRDLEEVTDAIATPEQLSAWLAARGVAAGEEVDPAAHAELLRLRESLRALLRGNNGEPAAEEELAPLRSASERARYRPVLTPGGEVEIAPAGAALPAFEARLLLAVERLQSLGAWARVKACTDDECLWAFYDTTRNRSRTWCSMEECGNREKTRRYRERQAAG
jgi:predicted RNA-binding Zn ribbon-like protein